MPCATTLYFDLETDAAIRRLWQGIEDAGLVSTMPGLGYRPHLSLAVCETMDLPALRDLLPAVLADTPPIALVFSNLGVFTTVEGVVFLGVTVSRALLDLHEKVWLAIEPHTSGHSTYYSPGVWVPHVTLNYGLPPDEVGKVVSAVFSMPIPVAGTATELVVTDVSETGFVDLFVGKLGAS